MLIYPTIQLMGGRCVSLDRARIDAPQVWDVDPVEAAQGFAEAGAEWMHLTDLDAVEGNERNAELTERIIRAAGIPVQLAGGFRSRDVIERWIDKGAGRIVVGSLAAQEPHLVKELAKYHPDQIVLTVDVKAGRVMTHGWRRESSFTPEDFIAAFDGVPLAGIVVTDIEADANAHVEAQMGLISGLARLSRTPVIASGVVRTVDDIARLKYIHNIAGALVGRALYQGTVDIAEALAVAKPEVERVADFV